MNDAQMSVVFSAIVIVLISIIFWGAKDLAPKKFWAVMIPVPVLIIVTQIGVYFG